MAREEAVTTVEEEGVVEGTTVGLREAAATITTETSGIKYAPENTYSCRIINETTSLRWTLLFYFFLLIVCLVRCFDIYSVKFECLKVVIF